jgi:rhamnose transport system ATP-binding protein
MPEQQLVEIACALGAGARIVIMDEPTAALTQREQARLFAVVRELRTAGVGVVYISHRLEEIFALADRVTVLRDGASVGTHPVAAMDEAGLIKLMVGREVAQLYPPAESPPGDVVLSLQDVGCAASGVRGVSLRGAGRRSFRSRRDWSAPAARNWRAYPVRPDARRCRRDQAPRPHRGHPLAAAAIEHGLAYVPEDRRRHGVIWRCPSLRT